MWTEYTIVTQLASDKVRRGIAELYLSDEDYRDSDDDVLGALARMLRFRPKFLCKQKHEKKVELMAKHLGKEKFLTETFLRELIVQYLLAVKSGLMQDFLDEWGIPGEGGHITDGAEYDVPSVEQARSACVKLVADHDSQDILFYYGVAGLVMGESEPAWRDALWAVVDDRLHEEDEKPGMPVDTPDERDEEADAPAPGSHIFSTLDHVLIKQCVAAVEDTAGALTPDEAMDLVEEVVDMADRQHSYFHYGFLTSLQSLPLDMSRPGMNDARRLWLITGYIMGRRRLDDCQSIVELHCQYRREIDGAMADHSAPYSYMLSHQIAEAYLRLERVAESCACLTGRPMIRERGPAFVSRLIRRAGQMYRKRRVPETRSLVALLRKEAQRPSASQLPLAAWQEVRRRHGQCLLAEGNFEQAEAFIEEQIAEDGNDPEQADLLVDLALAKGHFKWLSEVEVPRNRDHVETLEQRLAEGEDLVRRALEDDTGRRANAACYMGVLALIRRDNRAALDSFELALRSISDDRIERYREFGLYAKLELYYALAIFYCDEETLFEPAVELLNRAAADLSPQAWPRWLLRDVAVGVQRPFSADLRSRSMCKWTPYPVEVERSPRTRTWKRWSCQFSSARVTRCGGAG